jgi:predicted transcriptional regulator
MGYDLSVTPEALMSAKITISLPEEMLEALDAEARELGESRSLLIQEAAAAYLGKSAEERAKERRKAGVERALALAEELRAMPSLDGRPSIEILREIRDTDDAGR